jgi:hypothetical protein
MRSERNGVRRWRVEQPGGVAQLDRREGYMDLVDQAAL